MPIGKRICYKREDCGNSICNTGTKSDYCDYVAILCLTVHLSLPAALDLCVSGDFKAASTGRFVSLVYFTPTDHKDNLQK